MRARGWVTLLVVGLSLVGVSASAAFAEPPPGVPGPGLPPPSIPVPLAGSFTVHPDSGPAGSKVKITGACGFTSTQLLFGVHLKTANGLQIIWIPATFPSLKPTPFGVFSVKFLFPLVGNIPPEFGGLGPVPVTPGAYAVGAFCVGASEPMPFQDFTVTVARH